MSMLLEKFEVDPVAMRDAYCEALTRAAEEDKNILAVEADVMSSMGTAAFAKAFPKRSINCGIMEANAMGVCAGLSVKGFVPFFHTFGIFATRRCYDQIFVSGAYADCNIKIIGGDAGVTAAFNGGTHMPFEDMGIMRNIPGVTIVEPADTVALRALVPAIAAEHGVHYMRCCRKNIYRIYQDDARFTLGKANVLRAGGDVAIIACGIMVREALVAAQTLAAEGIEARVIDLFTIKPIDADCVLQAARETGAIVTVENHNIINGLGSAVCELLGENMPVPVERVGVNDRFGQVGTMEELMGEYGLTAENIVQSVKAVIARKE